MGSPSAGVCLPITPYLDTFDVDPETRRVLGVAFEMTCVALGLEEQGDLANKIIAKRIIELAKAGERNPDLLCERALEELRGHCTETNKENAPRDLPRPTVGRS
jgi:hypothetical protein